jgi:hypothetical protein
MSVTPSGMRARLESTSKHVTRSENQPPLAGSAEKYGLLLWWNLPSPRCARVPPVGQSRGHDDPVAWREVGDKAAGGLDDADSFVADDLAERIGQRQRVDQVDVRGTRRDRGEADEGVVGSEFRD